MPRPAPYWAYAWPGGVALARHLLDRPETVAGRQVLDLGAGSGLVAIAAARAGAAAVLAADIDPFARAAIALNAAENGVAVAVAPVDLAAGPPHGIDLVLAGDVFYEAGLAATMTACFEHWHAAGIAVLVGDVGRAWLPRPRLRHLADYRVADVGDAACAPARTAGVYRFVG
jgi:predicted nicotinamide N-methyase